MGNNKVSSSKFIPSHYLISGAGFLLLWIFAQFIPAARVFHFMNMAVELEDSGYILTSAVILVLINSTRAISLYLGWFLLGDGITGYIPFRIPSWIIPLVAIPLSYSLISSLGKGIVPHFGFPAVLSMASVLILHYMTREVSGWLNKALALALFIFSFQWFDVIPFMTPYGAGWGELSMAIKGLAIMMEREMVLNIAGFTLFCSLFLGGIITSELLIAYSAQINNLSLLRENEKKLALLREENIRNRGAVELQSLVHDLKRPLTTITGLTDVILSLEDPEEIKCHTSVISKAANTMNGMVSEILSAKARRKVRVSELIDYTRNQISPFDWKDQVRLEADQSALQVEIPVNLIRLSRALVNLLDNAHWAVKGMDKPFIGIYVFPEADGISIAVRDNGPGFGSRLPQRNVSGWNSTGIGLGFVRQVVEDNGGTMTLSDDLHGGGKVEIRFPLLKDHS